MHKFQTDILALFERELELPLNLTEIGRRVGISHPQQVKYHLYKLQSAGLLQIDLKEKKIKKVKRNDSVDGLVTLPFYGYANCGTALSFADDQIQAYVKMSESYLAGRNPSVVYLLRAVGDSMNEANLHGSNIEDGDYLVVDGSIKSPRNGGKYFVSVIDGCANVKRVLDRGHDIVLLSESNKTYPPIFIHQGHSYHVVGEVVRVIKSPSFSE